MRKKPKEKVSVACAGCGRTQTLRKSKVCRVSQYFTCSYACKHDSTWAHPYKPEGFVQVIRINAAGGFYGHEIREASDDERASLKRAQAIDVEGQKQRLEKQV